MRQCDSASGVQDGDVRTQIGARPGTWATATDEIASDGPRVISWTICLHEAERQSSVFGEPLANGRDRVLK